MSDPIPDCIKRAKKEGFDNVWKDRSGKICECYAHHPEMHAKMREELLELIKLAEDDGVVTAEEQKEIDAFEAKFLKTADEKYPVIAPAAGPELKGRVLAKKGPLDFKNVKERNGKPVNRKTAFDFENWGQNVKNKPAVAFYPETKIGAQNVVKFAKQHGLRVRCAGYRHSWSEIFCEEGQVFLSFLTEAQVGVPNAPLKNLEPPSMCFGCFGRGEKITEMMFIKMVSRSTDGKHASVQIGAATTNDQILNWCLENGWTLPLNVILVEVTLSGTSSSCSHGAGINFKTLSDIITAVEYVNVNGDIEEVKDPKLLKTAAGAFGLLGVILSVTIRMDKMTYASLEPATEDAVKAFPPPPGYPTPRRFKKQTYSKEDVQKFEDRILNTYYNEFFWFPYVPKMWIHAWKNDGKKTSRKLVNRNEERWQRFTSDVIDAFVPLTKGIPPYLRAKMFSSLAVGNLSNTKETVPLADALHFRRGIHNYRVMDMEAEIPIPALENGKPDLMVCRYAWWDAIWLIEKRRKTAPVQIALELRVFNGSDVHLAPENGNLWTCSIEILTNESTPREVWLAFCEEVHEAWKGRYPGTRLHLAKQWNELRYKGKPMVGYYKNVMMKDQIARFKKGLRDIGAIGSKFTLEDCAERFSNPLFDQLVFS